MTGLCGDDCIHCPRYIATKDGSVKELEKVKELWVRLGIRDPNFPVQDMACHGCVPENNCAYKELRSCIYEKGIQNCGWCEEYPCRLINMVFDKSEKFKFYISKICTQEEMDMLQRAFFSKKEYFDREHRKHFKITI